MSGALLFAFLGLLWWVEAQEGVGQLYGEQCAQVASSSCLGRVTDFQQERREQLDPKAEDADLCLSGSK